MATILQFRGAERVAAPADAERAQERSAEIIIFPGVRIERHASTNEPDQPRRGPRRPAQGS
jgi:hypothetical protein